MPSTHTSLHVHVTFSTKDRLPLIGAPWRSRLHEYLGGCAKGLGAKPVQIGGVADHVHLLLGMHATHAIADVVRDLKKASHSWAGQFENRFQWQDGYGAFSVSRADIGRVAEYIANQEAHHRRVTFQEEYLNLLLEEGVDYDARFIW